MVAVEPKAFKVVNCLDPGTFKEFSELGLYIFRFIKGSEPVYVIIDDRIPCLVDGNN